jgi:hypothetical protein
LTCGAAFCATTFFAAMPLAGTGGRGAGFFVAGAALFAAAFADLTGAVVAAGAFVLLFLEAGVVTGSPRNGDAILVREVRRGRRSRFGRRGL